MENNNDQENINNGSGAELGGFGDSFNPPAGATAEPAPQVGQSTAQPSTDNIKTNEPAKAGSVADKIAERLGGQGSDQLDNPESIQPKSNPIDISSLSPDQLQTLKQMLAATPDQIRKTNQRPTVTMRQIDGRTVVGFKNAYLGLIDDLENRRKVERHLIPVLFEDAEDYENVLYKKFMEAPRVECEVIEKSEDTVEIPEGTTRSRITGTVVEMVRKEIHTFFTVKLPSGKSVKLEAKLVNA